MIERNGGSMDDLISRQTAIDAFLTELTKRERKNLLHTWSTVEVKYFVVDMLEKLPSAQPEIEKICARIKAEAIKCNVEYMKHGDRYMLGFVDGMRLARRIVDGTIDDPVYFTTSGEKRNENTSKQH